MTVRSVPVTSAAGGTFFRIGGCAPDHKTGDSFSVPAVPGGSVEKQVVVRPVVVFHKVNFLTYLLQ